jgi:HTH-type transcriptional regulator/antitoxin HipB
VAAFDLTGALRRIRRIADLSQRQLAERVGASKSAVAAAESGASGLDVRVLERAAALAGLRLALLDSDGREVAGMADDTVRDLGRRRFPAHLDTVHSDDRPGRYEHRPYRPELTYTFERDRRSRDGIRRSSGTPDDHLRPQPGDSPAERRARRRQEAARRRHEERQRRLEAGDLPPLSDFRCRCPPECADLDIGERPQHTEECACGCDLG